MRIAETAQTKKTAVGLYRTCFFSLSQHLSLLMKRIISSIVVVVVVVVVAVAVAAAVAAAAAAR